MLMNGQNHTSPYKRTVFQSTSLSLKFVLKWVLPFFALYVISCGDINISSNPSPFTPETVENNHNHALENNTPTTQPATKRGDGFFSLNNTGRSQHIENQHIENTHTSADASMPELPPLPKGKVVVNDALAGDIARAEDIAELADLNGFDTVSKLSPTEIEVEITGVKLHRGGNVCVSVFNNPRDFLKEDRVIAGTCMDDLDKSFKVILPQKGKYALAILHDTDNSKDLSTGLFGIPKEGFGFSRNPIISFGPPSFEEASVFVQTSKKIVITMKYFL